MATTSATLKATVCAFLNRKAAAFVVDTVDLALQACNNARLYAERMIDFELSAVQATVAVTSPAVGGSLADAKLYGTSTAVSIKKVITAYVTLASDLSQSPVPIKLMSRKSWERRLGRDVERTIQLQDTSRIQVTSASPLVVVQSGSMLYATPLDATTLGSTYSIHFSGLKWLPAYSAGTETDFLLDNCFDWMMYKCISELNFFLKEDERVSITEAVLEKHWNAVIKWNNELVAANVDDVNLE